MEKSIAKVNEQLYRKLESEELISSVRTLETNVQAARDHPQRFEKLSREMKVSQISESAGE